MTLRRLDAVAGYGGTLGISVTEGDDEPGLYVTAIAAGVTLAIGLEDDDARALVALLERGLRRRSTERRLDVAALCRCRHPRAVHEELHGACRDDSACACLVMRPVSVIPGDCATLHGGEPLDAANQRFLNTIPEPTRSTLRALL